MRRRTSKAVAPAVALATALWLGLVTGTSAHVAGGGKAEADCYMVLDGDGFEQQPSSTRVDASTAIPPATATPSRNPMVNARIPARMSLVGRWPVVRSPM